VARIVLATIGSYGDLFPYLALGRALASRGHSVVVATSPSHGPIVEAAGLGFHMMRPDIDPSDRDFMTSMMDQRRGTERVFRLIMDMTREGYEDLAAATHDADVLVTHPLAFAGPLIARRRPSLRWASSVLAPASFFSAYDPPLMPQAPWMADILRRLGPGAGRTMTALMKRVTQRWLGPLHALAADMGLTIDAHPFFEGQHASDLVLAMYSSALAERQPDFPPQTVITGFLFYDANPAGVDAAAEAQARTFAADGEPPIVVTFGSSAVWIAEDAFAETIAMGRRTIALVGPDPAVAARYRGMKDVLAIPYLPHHIAMPLASVIIHQGGIGTTGQALRAGRPAVIVPFSHDQPDNAARCERLGLARVIPRSRYSRRTATAALSAIADDPSYAERAKAIGARVRAERGAETACDALETLLTDTASRRTA
jgi:rhamnosyltransferase subunit B